MSKYNIEGRKKKIRFGRILLVLIITSFIILNIKFNLMSKIILIIKPISVEKIEISVDKIELEPGECIDIKKNIFPENFSKSNFIWHNSNDDILEIQDDKIIGKKVGKSSIFLSDEEITSNEIEIECLIKPKDVSIENLIEEMKLGDIYKLEIKILPEDSTYKELQYETNAPEIVTVNDDGNLIANSIRKSNYISKGL